MIALARKENSNDTMEHGLHAGKRNGRRTDLRAGIHCDRKGARIKAGPPCTLCVREKTKEEDARKIGIEIHPGKKMALEGTYQRESSDTCMCIVEAPRRRIRLTSGSPRKGSPMARPFECC